MLFYRGLHGEVWWVKGTPVPGSFLEELAGRAASSSAEPASASSATADWNCEERIARIPSGLRAPAEVEDPGNDQEFFQNCSISGLDASVQLQASEVCWYDTLPGDPVYLDNDPEDLMMSESLLESLDDQRQVRIRAIREQEACFDYELGRGEGHVVDEGIRGIR